MSDLILSDVAEKINVMAFFQQSQFPGSMGRVA